MIRSALAAIVGVVGGGAVVAAVQFLNYRMYPTPPGLDLNNPKDLATMMDQISLAPLLGLELSYFLGSLVAGLLVGKLAGGHYVTVALVVGAVFTGFNVLNLISIPHPIWLSFLTTVTFIPTVLLAAWLLVTVSARG